LREVVKGTGQEFVYNHYPDEDYWKKPLGPPLDFPDTDDTSDTASYQDYHSKIGRQFVDSGLVNDIWYDIVDGKKVYKPLAGVNEPMEDI
jgi:hypothetical protein